ncbi:MAG: UDP-N-acetylglucosamine 1-carboxyvinyltransferase [Oscillospiraceae bacterium]|nr:UDP-N-acetylglucosamine 1-carboxyvinyltransferase [Oscillospiraceae bacterium]
MDIIKITGGRKLYGEVHVQGAKNSVLPILAASLLSKGTCVIHNCPSLSDVTASLAILRHLGCRAKQEGSTVIIDSVDASRFDVPHDLMSEMRSSVIFLGAVLARFHRAELSLPGGCELGPRPIDLHIKAMEALGADFCETAGNISCKADSLNAADINFTLPSVGATENAMIAACAANGTTVITNAAREPEIADLQNFLNAMGAKVKGAGTSTVIVEGVSEFHGCTHTVIPDRIVAATYMSAAVSAGGEIFLRNTEKTHLEAVTDALRQTGADIDCMGDVIHIIASDKPKAIRPVVTRPYPGFATDAQPPVMAAVLKAEGTSVFVENIFENRFRHGDELNRLGADIRIIGRVAAVTGVDMLRGIPVRASDLRGGAALVVAALGAEGETLITDIHHIRRGYDDIVYDLNCLGACAGILKK